MKPGKNVFFFENKRIGNSCGDNIGKTLEISLYLG